MVGQGRREAVLAKLVEHDRVWPLIDSRSCRACAIPRTEEYHRGYATCFQCHQLHGRYDNALRELLPITYTTPDWSVGASMRRFKDQLNCRQGSRPALGFGAVLSAYLELQLDRLAPPGGFDLVMAVPSGHPTIVNSLRRARSEGWWTPDLAENIASVRRGFPPQRRRSWAARDDLGGKWIIGDPDSVTGGDVLLLDDILTTGNSVHSFARALRDAGARSVTAVVLARNIGVGDGQWVRPLLEHEIAGGRPWSPGVNKQDVIR